MLRKYGINECLIDMTVKVNLGTEIFVCQEKWKHLLHEPKDSRFVRKTAKALCGIKELYNRSITGVPCWRFLKRKGGPALPEKRALSLVKLLALRTLRFYRRCGEKPETAFHICQECESVHLSRTELHNYVSRQVARLIRKRNPALTVREKPRFTTRDGVRLKPALVIESDDQVIMIDLAIVWDANEGVLKYKAGEKGAKYRVLKDLSDRQKAFSLCGMVFGARSMVCRETVELGLALRFS
ncbi:hypothetical protein MRX96_015002 [Rhipicephalus microplus]